MLPMHRPAGVLEAHASMHIQSLCDARILHRHTIGLSPVYLPLCTPQEGNTPLHRAAIHGRKEVAALLLHKGADLEAVDLVSSLGGMWVQLHSPCLHHVSCDSNMRVPKASPH